MKNVKGIKKNVKKLTNEKVEGLDIDYGVVEAITYKCLKVVYSKSGDAFVNDILTFRKSEVLEDLQQAVVVAMLESGYILNNVLKIGKHAFRCNGVKFRLLNKKYVYRTVNGCLYNYRKENVKNMEIIVNENNRDNLENIAYLEFLKEKNCNSFTRNRLRVEDLGLTDRQTEILNIYAKVGSVRVAGELLGISFQAISKTLGVIQKKANAILCA